MVVCIYVYICTRCIPVNSVIIICDFSFFSYFVIFFFRFFYYGAQQRRTKRIKTISLSVNTTVLREKASNKLFFIASIYTFTSRKKKTHRMIFGSIFYRKIFLTSGNFPQGFRFLIVFVCTVLEKEGCEYLPHRATQKYAIHYIFSKKNRICTCNYIHSTLVRLETLSTSVCP